MFSYVINKYNNNMRPNTDPCGTPDVAINLLEIQPLLYIDTVDDYLNNNLMI